MKQRMKCLYLAVCLLWICATPGYAADASVFSDVSPKSPFYDAIGWAVQKNITKGTTETTFSPSQTCSRQQILTFLWRYRGRPRVDWNGFADTPTNLDFQSAANWAYVNGLETGVQVDGNELRFQGNLACTRAAAVTYLWLLSGRPDADVSYAHQFADVTSGTALYAVAWAVQKGITNGTTPTSFSPDSTCTRGQIVTFLYRYSKI